MTRSHLVLASPLVLALLASAAMPACSSDDSAPAAAPASDGGSDATRAPETGTTTVTPDPDASVEICKLNDGTDPIALCVQKVILRAEHAVFDPKHGMPRAWSVDTGLPDADGGVPVHDAHDDVAYGASLAAYAMSADVYGDTEIANPVSDDMAAVALVIAAELATLPAEYSGTLYLRLRRLEQGLRFTRYPDEADKVRAVAEAYGRAIYTTYFHALSGSGPVVSDAGADSGGALDAAAADAGDAGGGDAAIADAATAVSEAGDAAPPLPGDGILGTPVSSTPGTYEYLPADAATGALALVDMAARHAADDATSANLWLRAAASVLGHLGASARDPSGLYSTRLQTTGSGPDTAVTPPDPADRLSSDVQATVALSLLRAAAIVRHSSLGVLVPDTLESAGASLLAALQKVAPSLWDGTSTLTTQRACANQAGLDAGAVQCGAGYYASVAPSASSSDTSKTVTSNALAFAALHRANTASVLPPGTNLVALRALLTVVDAPNGGFLTVFPDQLAFVPVASRGFDVAGGDSGAGPADARRYTAAANADALEGLTEQWIGVKNSPPAFY